MFNVIRYQKKKKKKNSQHKNLAKQTNNDMTDALSKHLLQVKSK